MIDRHASFVFLQHLHGSDGRRDFNKWKGSTGASGGELDEIITYFLKKGDALREKLSFVQARMARPNVLAFALSSILPVYRTRPPGCHIVGTDVTAPNNSVPGRAVQAGLTQRSSSWIGASSCCQLPATISPASSSS